MSKMFMPIKFNTTVILTPKELNKNFDSTILSKVKSTLENNCSKHGFIKKDSIKVIKRTAGYFKESHLNGNIAYDLSCIASLRLFQVEDKSFEVELIFAFGRLEIVDCVP